MFKVERLSATRAESINRLYQELRKPVSSTNPAKGPWNEIRRSRGLSDTTISHVHSLLKAAFKWANRTERSSRDPMSHVDAPIRSRSSAGALQIDEAVALLQAIRDHRLEAPMMFCLGTGMRRAEVIGLRWSSVDVERRTVLVQESRVNVNGTQLQKSTKTNRIREVPLNDLSLKALRMARKRYNECKLKSRPFFVESGFVFINEMGGPMHPNALTDAFRRVFAKLEDKGLPHRRLHDLRHTAGTIMLAFGMDVNTVQAILGHSTPITTLAVYGHVLKGRKEEAIRVIDAALGGRKSTA
jgi:integrase